MAPQLFVCNAMSGKQEEKCRNEGKRRHKLETKIDRERTRIVSTAKNKNYNVKEKNGRGKIKTYRKYNHRAQTKRVV